MSSHAAVSFFSGAKHINIHGGNFGSDGTNNGYDRLLQATAPNALHNSGHIPDPQRCHPGTRVAAINAIINWMEGKDEQTNEKGICWLTGAAGAGKTAIGRSICERCEEEGKPLASFFFYSGDTTRDRSEALVPTLCSQLYDKIPGIQKCVNNAMKKDSHILHTSLKVKFKALIIAPLLELHQNAPYTAPLIVIDGLDECLDKSSQREILDTLLNILQIAPVSIRFLILSRPEIQISNFFNTSNSTAHTFKIFLSDEYSPNGDIELFLRDRFRVIRDLPIFEHFGISGPWPTEEQIRTLVQKSSGQFIFAATVVKYVESPEYLPHERLEAVLNVQPSRGDSPFAGLDALYRHLVMTTKNPSETIDILAVPAIYTYVTTTGIESILQLQPGVARLVLSNLASIVNVRDSNSVTFLHKSFVDFLFDRYRSDNLFVDKLETHGRNILRIIEIFAERPSRLGLRKLANEFTFLYENSSAPDILESRSCMAIVNALIKFPMQSLCEAVFQESEAIHYKDYYYNNPFFPWIFDLMLDLKRHHPKLEDALHRHLRVFCECNLSFLNAADELWNWELNYYFAVLNLEWKARIYVEQYLDPNISWGDTHEFWSPEFEIMVEDIFQSLLTSKASQSLILARAAVFCLTFLCSNQETKAEANRHLKVNPIIHTKQKTYPLLWKRRRPSYKSFSNRPVLLKDEFENPGKISTYGNMMELKYLWSVGLYSLSGERLSNEHKPQDMEDTTFPPFNWNASETPAIDQLWYRYMIDLKYVSYILSNAGPYDPLIEMCKTKSLAKMSMMFEKDSRRVRRAITRYLERVGVEGNVQIETNQSMELGCEPVEQSSMQLYGVAGLGSASSSLARWQ